MKDFIDSMEKLPLWLKLVLALPALDVVWNIYRTMRSAVKHNLIGIVLGILLITVGIAIMWLIDIICLLFNRRILWID